MKSKILIVDDDLSVRDSLTRVLEISGYSVAHAPGGAPGLEEFSNRDVDLLLLDLDLPELRGWEMLEFALERRPDVRIILLTGLLNQCAEGAFVCTDAVIEKPTDVSLLLQTIANVLARPRKQNPGTADPVVTKPFSLTVPGATLPTLNPAVETSRHQRREVCRH